MLMFENNQTINQKYENTLDLKNKIQYSNFKNLNQYRNIILYNLELEKFYFLTNQFKFANMVELHILCTPTAFKHKSFYLIVKTNKATII